MGHPHLTWMNTAIHGMGSLGYMLHIDLPRDLTRLGEPSPEPKGVVSRF